MHYKVKTSDKNTGPYFSILLKTTCKNSGTCEKKENSYKIITYHGFAPSPSIEGFRAKGAYVAFWVDFYFL